MKTTQITSLLKSHFNITTTFTYQYFKRDKELVIRPYIKGVEALEEIRVVGEYKEILRDIKLKEMGL